MVVAHMENEGKSKWRGELRYDEPMARHCSWRSGGCARNYFEPADRDELIAFLTELPANEPLLWIGLGSNLLVRDGGFDGTVICTKGVLDELRFLSDERVYAAAGTPCAKLARQSVTRGLTGAEFMVGIPGTVGGALAMNAGAFGGETWELVVRVEMVYRDGRVESLPGENFAASYRRVTLPAEAWFLGAELQLSMDTQGDGEKRIRKCLAQRATSQPTGMASCGSVFRNPIGAHAGALIEQVGLKGHRIGDAQISPKHANFIVNLGAATARDIESLIELAQQRVAAASGIELVPEVRIVGEGADAE
jgi:UDP-N-acetylmuramate dehydrogenase